MTMVVSLQEWLVDRGLTPQEADLWSDFIADSLDLIVDGHSLLREANEWTSFLTGCKGASPTEPEITSGLGDRMRRLRNEAPIDSNRDRLYVSYESPVSGDERHGPRKFKADFRLEKKFEAGFSAEFVIEAKPLRIQSDMNSKYLSTDGLGCFTERNPPYSRSAAVGMLGYAYSRYDAWVPMLTTILSASAGAIRNASVQIDRDRVALVSDHARVSLGLAPVTVLHSILDFMPI